MRLSHLELPVSMWWSSRNKYWVVLGLMIFVLFAKAYAQEQEYDLYIGNRLFKGDVLFVKNAPYASLPQLCKALDLELNSTEGSLWIGKEPAHPMSGKVYVNGDEFGDVLVKSETRYVKLSSFLPKVNFRLLVNEQTHIIDIIKKVNPADNVPINKYLSDDVMHHLESNADLHAYLEAVRKWNTDFISALNESLAGFEIALNSLQNIQFYQDLQTACDKVAIAFKKQSEQFQHIQDSFPKFAAPPKEFAKSHARLVEMEKLLAPLSTASLTAYHVTSGISLHTKVGTHEYVTTLDLSPVRDPVINLLMLGISLDEQYAAYLKTLRSDLTPVLLATHYVDKQAQTHESDLPVFRTKVQGVRNLDFVSPVKGVMISPDEEVKYFEKALSEVKPEEFAQDDAILKDFAYIPRYEHNRNTDLKAMAEEIPAFYDPETKQFYYRSDVPEDMFEIICYHELTHALADQHYDLEKLTKVAKSYKNSDLDLAFHAVVEGDAEYTMVLPEVEKYSLSQEFLGDTLLMYQVGNRFTTAEGPMCYKEFAFFPYADGMKFMKQLHAWGGWGLQNDAYVDPPISTHQILHPESFALLRDYPVDFEFPEGAPGELVANDVMGEFGTLVLYATYHSGAKEDFSGWRGDRFHIFRNKDQDSIVWVSSWKSESDAAQFAKLYKDTLNRIEELGDTSKHVEGIPTEQKHTQSFEQTLQAMASGKSMNEVATGRTGHEKSTYESDVIQKGTTVIALQNIPIASADDWKKYADQVKLVAPMAHNPTPAMIWPFQDFPTQFSGTLTASQKTQLESIESLTPESWTVKGTNSASFPVVMENSEGDRLLIGTSKFAHPITKEGVDVALSALSLRAYPEIKFQRRSDEFGETPVKFVSYQGVGLRAGKPIYVAVWAPEIPSKQALVVLVETSPTRWSRDHSVYMKVIEDLATLYQAKKL